MMIPDAWLDDQSEEIEMMLVQQRLRDVGALLVAFKANGDERLLEMAITLTGEYDE